MRISDWGSDVCSSDLAVAEEQALVFAQRILDLAVARQRGVVVDAQAGGGLELGLVVVADAAFGHQPRGLVGEAVATFAGARFGVLTGAMHGDLPAEAWANSTPRPLDVHVSKAPRTRPSPDPPIPAPSAGPPPPP